MAALLVLAVGLSCAQDDQFDIPDTTLVEFEPDGTILTIDAVLGIFAQAVLDGETEVTFDDGDTDVFVAGYVISSDEGGNWFEELVVQDKAENPTVGIKVLIDVNPLFTRYEIGRKIYVKLNGLTVAITNGVVGIGIGGGAFIDKLPATAIQTENTDLGNQHLVKIFRSAEVAEIVPLDITLDQIIASGGDSSFENLFIRLGDVQFNRNDVLSENPVTFAAEPTDEFDGNRILESCEGGGIIVQTSTFADFKGLSLPAGRGSIYAILSRDFFDEFFTLVVNEPNDIQFDGDAQRCDPEVTTCDTPSGGGTTFFSENFESFSNISELEAAGWAVFNTTGGSTLWELGDFSGNTYAQITAFSSGEDTIASWLISPAIDMNTTTQEEFLFDLQASFDNGRALSVFFTNNFSGDPTTADWNLLDASIPTGPSGGFGDFAPVGPINVSCLEGIVHFAFLYTGSESGPSTRYHLDNVELTGI